MAHKVGISIPGIRAVGMHHWGGVQLDTTYTLRREPNNQYDPLAVAIKDGNTTKAYIKREDASRLARVMDANLVSGHKVSPPKVRQVTESGSRADGGCWF